MPLSLAASIPSRLTDLRTLFAYAVKKGWLAQWSGHSEAVLFAHYRELVPKAEAERVWKLRRSGS